MAREYKHSGIEWIGEIPKEWEVNKIGNLYHVRNEKVSDKDFPPLSVTMNGIVPQLETAAKTNNGDDRKLVRKGDFAINSRSDRRGSCGVSQYDGSVSLINTILMPRTSMNSQYYNWLFHTELFADEFYKWGHGIVDDLWTTRWQEMKNISIVYPSLAEQQKIANYLDKVCGEVDEMIALQEQMIEELKAYKQSVITEAVTKGLNPDIPMKDSGIDWIGEVPEGWDISRIGMFYFVTKLAGFEYTDILMNKISPEGDVPIVRAQNVRMFNFNKESISEFVDLETSLLLDRCSLDKRALLMTFIGAGIGDVCLFNETQRFHLAPNVAKLELNEAYKSNIQEEYVMYYLGSDAGKGEINKISKASAQASLSMSTIRKIAFTLPPLSEQQSIASYLDTKCAEINALIAVKQAKIDELKDYKKSVIYEYVTGKKEVV